MSFPFEGQHLLSSVDHRFFRMVKSQSCYPFVRSCEADMLYFLLTLTIRLEPLCQRKWQFLGIESSGFKKRLKQFCGFLFENNMQSYRIQKVNLSVRIIFSYEKFELAFRKKKKMLSCCKRFKVNFSTVSMVESKNVCCLPSWSHGKARYMSYSFGNAVKGYVGSVSHPDHMVE